MKKLLLPFIFFSFIALVCSCKKCYTCTNECIQCNLYQADSIADRQRFCSDSSFYESKKSALEAAGYTCIQAPTNYKDDFCANKPGAENYLNYHGANRHKCLEQ